MGETVLITDSCCDLPPEILEAAGVSVLPFPYTLNGEEHLDDFGRSLSYEDFYAALDQGAVAHTSQVPLAEYYEAFERATAEGKAVVLVSLSSGLSGTHDTSMLARDRFLDEHPEAEIHCVDSLCVSSGQGMLVLAAAQRLANGEDAAAVAEWVEENRLRVHHVFTVDSFDHLVRGGRVSPAAAMVGTMLNIKPILHVDAEGHLVPRRRMRGRHHAIEALSEYMAAESHGGDLPQAFISHGDCAEDAAFLAGLLSGLLRQSDIVITRTGTIVGAHTGGGILSVFFWGQQRA